MNVTKTIKLTRYIQKFICLTVCLTFHYSVHLRCINLLLKRVNNNAKYYISFKTVFALFLASSV